MSSSPSRAGRSARRTTTRRTFSRPQPAAACRRGCSRRCARSAASPIRSMPSTGTIPTPDCSASTPARPTATPPRSSRPRSTAWPRPPHRLDDAEIRRAKAQMKVSILAALESPGARAQQLARQMQIYGRPLSLDEMIARVEAISVDDVRKTGAAMLRSPPTIATIGAVAKVPGQGQGRRGAEGSLMALFGLTRTVNPEPLLRGDGLYLRPATPADYPAWSQLRAASRAFLEPWEPTWPDDDLTQAAFRRRLKRQEEDIARDEAYAVPDLRPDLGPAARRRHARRRAPRRLADRHARLLDGRGSRRQGAHDPRRRGDGRVRLRADCGCIGSRPPAFPTMRPRSRCSDATASSARAMRAAISRSTAPGATMFCSGSSRATRGRRPTAG